jgi:hypothetical protein
MYENTRIYSIEPHCPWYKAQQSYGPPNVKWCEQTQCSWINEPANTWSNLGFLLIGILIYKKLSEGKDKLLKELGVMIFLMGAGSFVYHATNNFFTQFFDFLGMFLMTSIVLGIFTRRIQKKDIRTHYAYSWMYLFFNTFIFWVFHFNEIAIQFTVVINTVALIGMEVASRVIGNNRPKLHYFSLSLVSLGAAQTFSAMDLKRTWCEPENLFLHGHAIWHVLAAVGMWFLALHVRECLRVQKN